MTKKASDRQLGAERSVGSLVETAASNDTNQQHGGDHARGLLLVGLFKLSKALFFGFLGAMALHLIHQNFGDLVMRVVDALPIDPESHLVSIVMDKADLVGGHQLRQAGMFSFAYAGLCVIEGGGLVTRQGWAEYFTVILTTAALPWEGYELVEHYALYKVGVLVVNVGVLVYLLWVLKGKRQGIGSRSALLPTHDDGTVMDGAPGKGKRRGREGR